MKRFIIKTDGGARGNPGPAGIGVVIWDSHDQIVFEHGSYIGQTTNNVAEYSALLKALETARDMNATHLDIFMDSELIVKQMLGQYKIKEPTLQKLAAEALKLKNNFQAVTFAHVPREQNRDADKMVNKALDEQARLG